MARIHIINLYVMYVCSHDLPVLHLSLYPRFTALRRQFRTTLKTAYLPLWKSFHLVCEQLSVRFAESSRQSGLYGFVLGGILVSAVRI